MTVEGHALENVVLGGWAYGPELGTAPVVVIVGGITASPFPLGDDQAPPGEPREAWWPAIFAPDLIDPTRYTVLCPCWPGNVHGRTEDASAAVPAISVRSRI